jgi:sporulation protein YlmC with PRC-barrel domain
LKFSKLIDEDVFIEDQKFGKIKDVYINVETWEITHFEILITKEAAYELLGARTAIRNSLAITALKKGVDDRVEIQVSKGQVHMYLRPPE